MQGPVSPLALDKHFKNKETETILILRAAIFNNCWRSVGKWFKLGKVSKLSRNSQLNSIPRARCPLDFGPIYPLGFFRGARGFGLLFNCSSEGEARARTLTTADHNISPTWGGNDNFRGEQQKCAYSLIFWPILMVNISFESSYHPGSMFWNQPYRKNVRFGQKFGKPIFSACRLDAETREVLFSQFKTTWHVLQPENYWFCKAKENCF